MTELQWKWADLIVKGVGVALITGAVTLYGINAKNSQEEIALRATQAENERDRKDRQMNALVEFASAQKKLDVDVGMQLFRAFIDKYFDLSSDEVDQIRENFVLLRLIALNFQDVPINLKPLFEDLDQRLIRLERTTPDRGTTHKMRAELQEIAKEVANRQAFRLTFLGGGLVEFDTTAVNDVRYFRTVPFAIKVMEIKDDSVTVEILETELDEDFFPVVMTDGRRIGPFEITYFDMPILDNVKVDGETRLAVQLKDVNERSANLRAVSFHADLATDRFDVKEMSRDVITGVIEEEVFGDGGSPSRAH